MDVGEILHGLGLRKFEASIQAVNYLSTCAFISFNSMKSRLLIRIHRTIGSHAQARSSDMSPRSSLQRVTDSPRFELHVNNGAFDNEELS